jgi:hypothetical protein
MYVEDLGNSVANAKGEIEVTLFGPFNVTSFGFVIHEKVDSGRFGDGKHNHFQDCRELRKSIGLWKYSIGFRRK